MPSVVARKHPKHVGTQARKHKEHASTQARWARDSADSSQSLQGKQENPFFNASRYVNNSFSVYFFLELSYERMKAQVKRAFKGSFFVTKETIRKQASSAWNFLQSSIQMRRGACIPCFKINAPIFCYFIFFEECLNRQVRIYEMLNEHTVDNHPSPSEFTSRIHPLIHFSLDS